MTSLKPFVLLMLAFGIINAFGISDYLYPSEPNTSVQFKNFTLDGTPYSIVSISGSDTFLLRGAEIVTDKSDIESILKSYYSTYFFPSSGEMENLTNLIQAYNASRNDGQKFRGKEEYICRGSIFIDGRVTWNRQPITCRNETDDDLCKMAANLMFQYLSSSTGAPPVASPADLYPSIKEFGFASYGTDYILANDISLLEAAESDQSKMSDALAYLKNSTPQLSIYKGQMENNLFTLTKNRTVDAKHWGLCPDISLNGSVLDDISASVKALSDKMVPYDNRDTVSKAIADNTAARLVYLKNINQAQYFNDLFSGLNASGTDAISLGKSAILHVSSDILSSKLEKLIALQTTIPEDISAKDFTNLDSDISQYKNLTQELRNLSNSALGAYNDARNAKIAANSILLMLETKDSDFVTLKSLGVLQNETEDLNARFRDGLTTEELAALASNYSSIETRARPLLDNNRQLPATRVLTLFRSFARKVNVGIAKMAAKTDVIAPTDVPKGSAPLGAFSALVLLSFASIALVIFLFIFSSFRFSVPKTGHILGVAFLCALIALIGFTLFMFLFLGKTSTDANLQEFITDFNTKNDTSIFLDLSNVSSISDTKAMQNCASVLSDSLEDKNKTWTLYTLTSSSCTRTPEQGANSSMSVSDCMNISSTVPSSFVLSYSPKNEVPKFTVIYQNKALIKGNQDYYDSCPIVAFFS
jgi:hypothetical protein